MSCRFHTHLHVVIDYPFHGHEDLQEVGGSFLLERSKGFLGLRGLQAFGEDLTFLCS